jgi:hypothetical protein
MRAVPRRDIFWYSKLQCLHEMSAEYFGNIWTGIQSHKWRICIIIIVVITDFIIIVLLMMVGLVPHFSISSSSNSGSSSSPYQPASQNKLITTNLIFCKCKCNQETLAVLVTAQWNSSSYASPQDGCKISRDPQWHCVFQIKS